MLHISFGLANSKIHHLVSCLYQLMKKGGAIILMYSVMEILEQLQCENKNGGFSDQTKTFWFF